MKIYAKIEDNKITVLSQSEVMDAQVFSVTTTVFNKIFEESYDVKYEDNKLIAYKGERYKIANTPPELEATPIPESEPVVYGMPEIDVIKLVKKAKILSAVPMHKQLNLLAETLSNIGEAIVNGTPVNQEQLEVSKEAFETIQRIRNS